jgi:dihydrofolate synthase/folylpolyglutamate synthase
MNELPTANFVFSGALMTYEETLAKIDTYHRFSREPGLERMKELLRRLGNPQNGLRAVHVAGTNGKGTTSTLLASILTEAGYRAGLTVSPHVCDFRERLQLNGQMIPRQELVAISERVFREADTMIAEGMQLTEFEVITAMAFLWFAEKKCDVAVLEVGLGGRFDATNVIESPLVSVIVSISLDHTEILGGTVEKIATEKCGIIKPGCPVVCSPGEPEGALKVIRRTAEERGCALTEASISDVRILSSGLAGTKLVYQGETLPLSFPGTHQVQNAATVLAAVEVLRSSGLNISADALRKGFSNARLPARFEVLSENPPVLIDGAHNPGGTSALAATLRSFLPGRKIVAIMGMMADKDAAHAVENLSGLFSYVVAAVPPSPRGMSAEEFAALWRKAGTVAGAANSADEALRLACARLEPGSALLVCGSLYLAGELREPLRLLLAEHKLPE